MKTIIILLATMWIVSAADAQTKDATKKPRKTGYEWHAAGDAPLRAKAFADTLTAKLSLSSETSKKIHSTFLANTKSLDEIKLSLESDDTKRTQLKNNKDAFDEQLQRVLTSDQYAAYKKLPENSTWKLNGKNSH